MKKTIIILLFLVVSIYSQGQLKVLLLGSKNFISTKQDLTKQQKKHLKKLIYNNDSVFYIPKDTNSFVIENTKYYILSKKNIHISARPNLDYIDDDMCDYKDKSCLEFKDSLINWKKNNPEFLLYRYLIPQIDIDISSYATIISFRISLFIDNKIEYSEMCKGNYIGNNVLRNIFKWPPTVISLKINSILMSINGNTFYYPDDLILNLKKKKS